MDSVSELKRCILAEREAAFFRLRGGYPIAMAGAIYWAVLALIGFQFRNPGLWIFLAFVLSGMLFPLALLLARLFRIDFMRDRTPVSDVVFPAMVSMLLFWPMAIAAYWSYPQLVPLILGIGMSILWPVVGWSYGRTGLYTSHAVVRAIVCFVIWTSWPSMRFIGLPLAVSLIYLLTIVAILFSSSPRARAARRQAPGSA